MQMKRFSIKRHNAVGAKSVENVDLDEKIRRIREDNKKREQRFQEIEEDKKMASRNENSLDRRHTGPKTQPSKSSTMKGVLPSANVKKAKGRGQRLQEMTNYPLKAERFKSMVEGEMDICEHLNLQTFKLKNNCRSDIREKIKSRNTTCSDTESVVKKHEEIQESDICKKLVCIPESQQNEIPNEEKESVQLSEDVCEASKENETDKTSDDIEQLETVTEMKTNVLNKQQDKDPSFTTQKKDKPRITLKKTASSSSFDESMAMLSPLDVPSNWGDVDFSDEELPPVSIWKNP